MGVLGVALDLVLPQRCAGCGGGVGVLCAGCGALLGGSARPCPPRPPPPGMPVPWAVARYAGAVQAVIVAYKERGRTALARPLGAALARAVSAAAAGSPGGDPPVARVVSAAAAGSPGGPACGEPLLLVPVPSTRASVRRRGGDPTLRIAQVAAGLLAGRGPPVRCRRALRHGRRVADQSGLGAAGRRANLAGALVARPDLRGAQVIVVDDVVTSGASLTEAARALRAAGADVRGAAVIAATVRRTTAR